MGGTPQNPEHVALDPLFTLESRESQIFRDCVSDPELIARGTGQIRSNPAILLRIIELLLQRGKSGVIGTQAWISS